MKGTTVTYNFTVGGWYEACEKFRSLESKMDNAYFLRSEKSPICFTGKLIQKQSFCWVLKIYENGTPKNEYVKKNANTDFKLLKISSLGISQCVPIYLSTTSVEHRGVFICSKIGWRIITSPTFNDMVFYWTQQPSTITQYM